MEDKCIKSPLPVALDVGGNYKAATNGGSVIRSAYAAPFKFSDNLDMVVIVL